MLDVQYIQALTHLIFTLHKKHIFCFGAHTPETFYVIHRNNFDILRINIK